MSGITSSTTSISSSGNMRPASTMMRSSPSSKTIMFLPISPRPPRGITRSLSAIWLEEAHLLRLEFRGGLLRGRLAGLFQYRRYLAEVFFDDVAHVAGVEGGGRVVHGDEVDAVLHLGLAVNLADGLAGGEPGQGVAAQADDHLGPDEFDLALEVLAAGLPPPPGRGAGVWGAAPGGVGDE